jgi:hypothetical protein
MNNTATEKVVRKHLETFIEQKGIPAMLADYDPAARLYSAERVYEGHHEIGEFLADFMRGLPPAGVERFKVGTFRVDGDLAFITWSVGTDIPLGTDTFVVRDGKIVSQTFAMHVSKEGACSSPAQAAAREETVA